MLDNYNERLFNGKSIRSKFHLARYIWLRNKLRQYKCPANSVLELGCFDGKTLEFLDKEPVLYEGYDANWEGGLDIGKEKWESHSGYHFKLCTKTEDFKPGEKAFEISVCQETAEHLPVEDLNYYLEHLARATKTYCFISVPNERGIVFLTKHTLKFLTQKKNERENISFKDAVYSVFGRLEKVKRDVRYHKGFDYKKFQKEITRYFDIVETNGLPFSFLPISLSFTIGFVCKART